MSVGKVGEYTCTTSDRSYTMQAQSANAVNMILVKLGGLLESIEVDILPNRRSSRATWCGRCRRI